MQRKRTTTLIAIVLGISIASPPTQAESIQRQVQKQIPEIISYLNEQGHKTVGVLKFRVKKPGQKSSDRVGAINSLMADRLEVGLILSNPFEKSLQLNIIRDASAQVSQSNAADHLGAEGRQALLQQEYQLAWGENAVKPDAFLTGIVQMHDDNQRVTVGILCFDRSGSGLTRIGQPFDADLDASSLGELGESFTLRGAFDGGTVKSTNDLTLTAVKIAAQVKSQSMPFPLDDSSAPVQLEIRYDDVKVPVEMRVGRAFVREPREGQKVAFILTRRSHVQGRVGVVLKVNGDNTLYRQTQRDLDCSKWILSPQHTTTTVSGYQLSSGERQDFKVLSDADSAARAMDYGRNTGQIQLTVFPERTSPPELVFDDDEEDLIAMLRGVQPDKAPKNLSALKQQIRLAGKDGPQTRGLIVDGKRSSNKVKTVTFQASETPAMAVTITYYSR